MTVSLLCFFSLQPVVQGGNSSFINMARTRLVKQIDMQRPLVVDVTIEIIERMWQTRVRSKRAGMITVFNI